MNANGLVMFLLEGVLGYLVQHFSFVIGMHGIARKRIVWPRVIIVSVLCASILSLLRQIEMIQFGVHTLLNVLITNVGCVLICRMDIRKSVLGSLIMLIVTLLSDLVNFGVLLMMMDQSQISIYLQNEQNKAVSALPGNLVILAVALTLYYVRIRKREAEE